MFEPAGKVLNQLAESRCADFSSQPLMGGELNRRSRPESIDSQPGLKLIRLEFTRGLRLFGQMLVSLPRLYRTLLERVLDPLIIRSQCEVNRSYRAATKDQVDLKDGQISLSSLVVTRQPGRGAERLIEHTANVALSYRGGQANSTFFTSFSGLTAEVRTNFAHLSVQPFLSFVSY